ncbi:hypothetical protein PSD17_39350 [Pseudonocardia sp. D17]|nr:hypothetical protein PSD17_39350 [Pseudonocardia sp. D17]
MSTLDDDHPANGGPRGDRFHDETGRHRTSPPPGDGGPSWDRAMRLHRESHGTARYVATLLADIASGGR